MALIEWHDSFSIGIPPIDSHHRHLVELLNCSYDCVICGAPLESASAVLAKLVDYASYHFVTEEFWMSQNGYPQLAEHAAEHDLFTSRLREIREGFAAGKNSLTLDVLVFLRDWLADHILTSDADFGRYTADHPLADTVFDMEQHQ